MKKINLSHLDLEMYYDKINNLEVYVVPNNKGEGNYAVLTTKYGSIDNKFILDGKEIITPQGVAHFLEHKMFESENGTDPFNFYAEKGADANASTSYFKTSYLFSGSDNFEENLKFLLEYTNKPYFTDENIEKEQGIIGEEIKMVRDDPYRRMYEEIMNNVFINHPIKNSVIGTKESIASVTKEDLYTIYNSFYQNSNMILVVTGKVDYKKVFEIVKKYRKDNTSKISVQKIKYDEPDKVERESSTIIMDVSVPKVSMSYKINIDELNLNKIDIMTYASIYLNSKFGGSSIFNEKMKNQGIMAESCGFDYDIIDNHLVLTIFGESKNYNELLENIEKEVLNKEIEENSFYRYKKVLKSNLIYTSENIYAMNDNITASIIKYEKYEDRYNIIEKLNLKDYELFIKTLNFKNKSSLIIKNNQF